MAATKPVCMFCGTRAGPFDDEDVWPKWFRKTVIIDGPIRLQTPAFGRSWRKDGHLRLIIRDAICKRCNNGWMSQIEEEAARPLKRMVSLSVVTLSPEDRDAIALWAVLKACELEVAFSQLGIQPAIIPHGHTQWLYERQSVPPGTTVMLGAVLGALPGDNNATFAWRIAHTIGKESREVGLLSTFTLANVVFQVLAINLRKANQTPVQSAPDWRTLPERMRPFLIPIAPCSDDMPRQWPPEGIFVPADLDRLGLLDGVINRPAGEPSP